MKVASIFFGPVLVFFSLSTVCLGHDEVVERPGGNLNDIATSQDTLSFEEFLETAAAIREKQNHRELVKEKR